MELFISNAYGARMMTCDRHLAKVFPNFIGIRNVRIPSAEDRASAETWHRECADCRAARYLAELPDKVRAALQDPRLAHTRYRRGAIYIYHRDDTSPSGVLLAEQCDEKMFDEIFSELRAANKVPAFASPLSPTEGLRGSR